MNKNLKITEKDRKEADKLLRSISRIKGMKRVAYKCKDCGQIFAHHFIPFGIGRGGSFNQCLCQLTANRLFGCPTVLERTP
jgi:hypothetical protein